MSSTPNRAPVTVIGLGPMGRAMATTLMRAGHSLTVWNRTPSRAAELVAAGATLAPTAAAAVAAGELTILSLTDYQAMYDILGPAVENPQNAGIFAGKVLVNLSSDTPDASRAAAAWAADHGASF
jgi:3-hydroxyisobutyrate dehydrogenase-like beta-hydroxyacid dehydrogenase